MDGKVDEYASANESMSLSSSMSSNSLQQQAQQQGSTHLPTSMSSVGLDHLLKMDEMCNNDFQSLPVNMHQASGEPQRHETIKGIIEKTIKASLEEMGPADLLNGKSLPTATTTATTSTSTTKSPERSSSVLSLLGRMFTKKSSGGGESSPTKTVPSSSSPNPESSTAKLLDTKPSEPAAAAVLLPACSSLSHEILSESSVARANGSEGAEMSIEKLAGLNGKEQQQVDPVLSKSSDAGQADWSKRETGVESSSKSDCVNVKEEKNDDVDDEKENLKSVAESVMSKDIAQTQTMSVPASSQEFCANLNMNLALSNNTNAQTSPQQSTTTSPRQQHSSQCHADHNRFTKNASTSSIHNDLKAILEESAASRSKSSSPTHAAPQPTASAMGKEETKAVSGGAGGQKASPEAPKPQRERAHRSKHSKHQEKSCTSAAAQTTGTSELVKLLTEMSGETVGKAKSGKGNKQNKQQQQQPQQQPRHRYSKEFLTKIKDERATFISTIYPDIFKAYCYCMNGKYWDPEKYFDIIQYSGDYEKIKHQQQHQQSSQYQQQHSTYQTKNRNNNGYNRPNNKPSNKYFNPNGGGVQPRHPLANTNATTTTSTAKSGNDLFSSLINSGVCQQQSAAPQQPTVLSVHDLERQQPHQQLQSKEDKSLLNLLKNNNSGQQQAQSQSQQDWSRPGSINLMEMLNKKHTNIIGDLLTGGAVQSTEANNNNAKPKHYPMILTAQELEFSQLQCTQQNKQFGASSGNKTVSAAAAKMNHSLESCASETSGSSSGSSRSGGGGVGCSRNSSSCNEEADYAVHAGEVNGASSDAYKQLVKNLSNHPLSNTPAVNQSSGTTALLNKSAKSTNIDELLLSKLNQHKTTKTDEGTNLLKQLLNLNAANEGKPQSKSSKKHHHHQNKSSSNTQQSSKHSPHRHNHHHQHKSAAKTVENKQQQLPLMSIVESTVTTTTTTTSLKAAATQFPQMNPHEKPFQNMSVEQSAKPTATLESLMQKLKSQQVQQAAKSEQEHFSSLLNKLMPTLANHLSQEKVNTTVGHSSATVVSSPPTTQQSASPASQGGNILKWFNLPQNCH